MEFRIDSWYQAYNLAPSICIANFEQSFIQHFHILVANDIREKHLGGFFFLAVLAFFISYSSSSSAKCSLRPKRRLDDIFFPLAFFFFFLY